jgi:hypothetical protein
MQERRVFGIFLIAALAAVVLSAAQPLTSTQGRVYVSVTDNKGAKTSPRDAESFHIWENGASRSVVSAGAATEPPAIIVIIHGFERDETADARKALSTFVDAIRDGAPDARIAIIGEVKDPKLTNITADAVKLDETARRFALSGTNMVFYEAIVDAAKALGKESSDRRIIVTLTKATKHDVDHQTTPQTVAALKKSGASVWAVDVTPVNATQITNKNVSSEMDGFVQNAPAYTGGAQERLYGTAALPSKLARFAELILSQYQVTFTRPAKSGESELRIGVEGVPGEKVIGPAWFVR